MKNITFSKLVDDYVIFDSSNLNDNADIKIEAIKISNGKIVSQFKSIIKSASDNQSVVSKLLKFIKDFPILDRNYNILKTKRYFGTFELANELIDGAALDVLFMNSHATNLQIPDEWTKLDNVGLFIGLSQYEEIKKYIRKNKINLLDEIIKFNDRSVKESLKALHNLSLNHVDNFKDINEYVAININYQIYDDNCDIFGLYAFKVKESRIVDVYYKLLKPINKLQSLAQEVSGITDEMLKNCPTFEQVKNDFFNFIQNQVVVGYNLPVITLLNNRGANIKNLVSINMIMQKLFKEDYIDEESIAKRLNLASYNTLDRVKAFNALDFCLYTLEAFEKIKKL